MSLTRIKQKMRTLNNVINVNALDVDFDVFHKGPPSLSELTPNDI